MKNKLALAVVGGLLAVGGTSLVGIATGSATAAAPASGSTPVLTQSSDTTSCNGVLSGQGEGSLDKRLTSVKEGPTSGTYDFTFTVTSGRAPGNYRLRDCVYIDEGAPGYQHEPVIAGTDERGVAFTAGSGGSVAVFTIRVSGIGANKLVCDRAAVSGAHGSTDFTDKSNEVCADPNHPPVVPEAPLAVALPLVGLATLGAVWVLRRRRASPALA